MRLGSLPRWLLPALILLTAIALPRSTPSWVVLVTWIAYVVAAYVAMIGWWRERRARRAGADRLPEEP
jgi:hypothetical protein